MSAIRTSCLLLVMLASVAFGLQCLVCENCGKQAGTLTKCEPAITTCSNMTVSQGPSVTITRKCNAPTSAAPDNTLGCKATLGSPTDQYCVCNTDACNAAGQVPLPIPAFLGALVVSVLAGQRLRSAAY